MTTGESDTRQFYLLMFPIIIGPLLVALDVLALTTALPAMAQQLEISISQASLSFVLYILMFTGLILPLGALMDRTDCYRLLRWGYLLFAVGSLFCCLAQGIVWLCIGRCVQGAGGAILYAVTPVLVKRALPCGMRDRGYAGIVMTSNLGILAGPPLGGLITTMLGWQWIFALNLPLVGLGMWLVQNRSAPSEAGHPARSFDYAGAFYSFLSCTLLIIVLQQGKELGWSSAPVLIAAASGLISTLLFLHRQLNCVHPLIDPGLLRNLPYRTGLLITFLSLATSAGLTFLYPFFLTYCLGLSTMQTGMLLAIEPAFSLLACFAAASLAGWAGYRAAVTGTMGLRLCAVLALAAVAVTPSILPIVAAFAVTGIATGLQYGPLMAQIMAAVPTEHAGSGGSLFSQVRMIAQLLGVVLFETVFSSLQGAEPIMSLKGDSIGTAFGVCFLLAAVLLVVAGWCSLSLGTKRGQTIYGETNALE